MSRNADGTFAKGNKGGPGNPYARKVALIRNQIIEAVSEDDLREIIQALIKKAKSGDIQATKEILTRLIGKPLETTHPDQLESNEANIELDKICSNNRLKRQKETDEMFKEYSF